MSVLPTILQPQIVLDRFSRIKAKNDSLQRALGMQAGGPSVSKTPSRRGSYDIFDQTREVGSAVLPGVEATTRARFPVGSVNFNIPRHAEKIPLPMEELNQLRAIGGPVSKIDELGEQYIIDQEKNQKQTVVALREFQVAAMLRGSYTWTRSGTGFAHFVLGRRSYDQLRNPGWQQVSVEHVGRRSDHWHCLG